MSETPFRFDPHSFSARNSTATVSEFYIRQVYALLRPCMDELVPHSLGEEDLYLGRMVLAYVHGDTPKAIATLREIKVHRWWPPRSRP